MNLDVREYGMLRNVPLDTAQRDALGGCGAELTITPEPGTSDRWALRAGSHVGVVVADGLTLRIHPKLNIARLFVMLSAAGDSIRWEDHPAAVSTSFSVEDVVAMALADAIHSRLHSGLLRGYVAIDEESLVVRGRLDLAETFRRYPATLLPLVQTPEYLEEDIAENRIMLAAVNALLPRVGAITVRARLLECRHVFAGVTAIPPGAPLPRLQRTRLNGRWWDAVELALLVLRCCGLDLPAGPRRARAFLVDMNTVFERFVHRALADALRRHGRELSHGRSGLHLDEDRRHALTPDLSIWSGEQCLFAGDCKYKQAGDAVAQRDDLYQSLAYATAASLRTVMLVYGEGMRASRDVALVDVRTTVKVRVLNLDASASALHRQFSTLALEIALLLGESP